MKRIWAKVLVVVVALAVLVLPACSSTAPATQSTSTDNVIRIGVSAPLSGFAAGWGIPNLRAVELLVDKYNKAGGIDINGVKYTIKLTSYDDKFSASEGAIIAQRLVSLDKVSIVVMNSGASTTAARDILAKAGVIQWGVAYTKDQPAATHPLAFAWAIRYPEYCNTSYAWLVQNYPKVKTVALMTANMEWAGWAVDSVSAAATKQGLTMVAKEIFDSTTADFAPVLLKVLATKPDFLDLTGSSADQAGTIIKQARALGYTGLVNANWGGTDLTVVVKIAGWQAAEGVITGMSMVPPYSPQVQEVADAYLAKYGEAPSPTGLSYYANQSVIFQAIQRAQSLDTTKIANTIRGGEFETIMGKTRFGGKEYYGIDNQILTLDPIAMVSGGRFVQVTWLPPAPY